MDNYQLGNFIQNLNKALSYINSSNFEDKFQIICNVNEVQLDINNFVERINAQLDYVKKKIEN